jgi:hypothetical protein
MGEQRKRDFKETSFIYVTLILLALDRYNGEVLSYQTETLGSDTGKFVSVCYHAEKGDTEWNIYFGKIMPSIFPLLTPVEV